MIASANTIAICVMGLLSYLFCLLFPPFRETAHIIALLSTFALGAVGVFLWQESEAALMSPAQWGASCIGLAIMSLVIFFANAWDIGLSPLEALFFPKETWDSLDMVNDHLHYKGLKKSLVFGIGSLILGIGSLVRWWLLSDKSPLTTRSTRTARKRAVG